MSSKTIKKKKKRDQKIKAYKHRQSVRGAYTKKYPVLMVQGAYANIDLIQEVKQICSQFDCRKEMSEFAPMLHDHKTIPATRFVEKYKSIGESEENEIEYEDFGFHQIAKEQSSDTLPYIALERLILLYVHRRLVESGSWGKYMPIHHVLVRSYKGNFAILVNGFHQHHSEFGKGYYTEQPSFIEIPDDNGGEPKKYRVAISMHALERVFERTYKCSLDFELGRAEYPLFLYEFGLCNEFRPIKINEDKEWGVAIYSTYHNGPDIPNSIAHKIAFELLDRMNGFKLLSGYCPIGFCKDDFIHFKTLLSPGMRGTPEEKLILSIENVRKKEHFQKLVSSVEFTDEHIEVYQFFQNSGYHVAEYLSEEEKEEC